MEDLSKFLELLNPQDPVSPIELWAKFHQIQRWFNKYLKTPIVWKTQSIWLLVSAIDAFFRSKLAGTPQAEFWSDSPSVYSKSCSDKRSIRLNKHILKNSKRKMCTKAKLEITFLAIFLQGFFLFVNILYWKNNQYQFDIYIKKIIGIGWYSLLKSVSARLYIRQLVNICID